MDKQHRRDLIRAYQERKSAAGIYAIRCEATGQAWVARTFNVDAQQNSAWFALRLGSYRNPAVQAAWKAHGEAAFRYEVLERIDDEKLTPLGREDALKDRKRHWIAALAAGKALG